MNDFLVHIVDDDPESRSSISNIFTSAQMPVRTYSSAEEFIQQPSPAAVACLILDLRMPGMSGLELIELLRSRKIHLPVIVVSAHGDISAVVQSMKLGVAEFMEKPPEPNVLIAAVRRLLQSELERCDEAAKIRDLSNDFATLTEREREMVDLIVHGYSSKEIANKVGISVKTVENHRSHVLAKTHAVNVASLVRMKMMLAEHSSLAR